MVQSGGSHVPSCSTPAFSVGVIYAGGIRHSLTWVLTIPEFLFEKYCDRICESGEFLVAFVFCSLKTPSDMALYEWHRNCRLREGLVVRRQSDWAQGCRGRRKCQWGRSRTARVGHGPMCRKGRKVRRAWQRERGL